MFEIIYKNFRQSLDSLRKLIYLIPIERQLSGASFTQQLKHIERTDKLPISWGGKQC